MVTRKVVVRSLREFSFPFSYGTRAACLSGCSPASTDLLSPVLRVRSVAATKTPIIFIGTGEHVADLEVFRAGPFVSKMLGMGDVAGLMDRVQEVAMANPDRQKEMLKKIEEGGTFTIRDWREQLGNIMSM